MQTIECVKVATQHSIKGDCKNVRKYTVEKRNHKKRIENLPNSMEKSGGTKPFINQPLQFFTLIYKTL